MSDRERSVEETVASIPWFSELHPSCVEKLTEIGGLGRIEANERLFGEGDTPDYLYVLVRGRLAIEAHIPPRGRMRLVTIEPTEVFGWSGVAQVARRRTATVVAVLPSDYLTFPAKKLVRLCNQDPQLGYCVYHRVANTIASRLLLTRLQLVDVYAHPAEAGQG